jgi:hypothetical protein
MSNLTPINPMFPRSIMVELTTPKKKTEFTYLIRPTGALG